MSRSISPGRNSSETCAPSGVIGKPCVDIGVGLGIGVQAGFGRARQECRERVFARQDFGIRRIEGRRAGVKHVGMDLVSEVFGALAVTEELIGRVVCLADTNQP